MSYKLFLNERRSLIAQTIRSAYERLAGQTDAAVSQVAVADLIGSGETAAVEFKSTLRTNLHTGEKDSRMEMAVLKSIAGFLNSNGGTLVVGVADDGSPVSWERDGFPDEDKMSLHLINLLKDRLGR
jgi:Putative DNA-binding domain